MSLKEELYQHCMKYAEQRIANARHAWDEASAAANEETKSSAGDKHETGRAMAQLEQEKAAKQYAEAVELKKTIEKIDIHSTGSKIRSGSVVMTDKGNYFVAISAGKIEIEGNVYFAVSPGSPVGHALIGKMKNEDLVFNGQKITIREIL